MFNYGGNIYYSDVKADIVAANNFKLVRQTLDANGIKVPSDPSALIAQGLKKQDGKIYSQMSAESNDGYNLVLEGGQMNPEIQIQTKVGQKDLKMKDDWWNRLKWKWFWFVPNHLGGWFDSEN